MRCVFDTNVLVSALLVPNSKPRLALESALGTAAILLSFEVLAELYDVLNRKGFRRYVDERDIHDFLAALTREAQLVEVNIRIRACRDSKEDKFLELAVSGNADFVITGDSDLLVLNPFRGIEIVTLHSFVDLQKERRAFPSA